MKNYRNEFYENINKLTIDIIYEKGHINDELLELTDYIADFFIQLLNKIEFDINMELGPIYTEWNITPITLQDLKDGDDVRIVRKLNDKSKPYPIYISFKSKGIGNGQTQIRGNRVRVENNKRIFDTTDSILITINPMIFRNANKSFEIESELRGTINHELMHAFEQYVLEDRNVFGTIKNLLNHDFRQNKFNLNMNLFVFLNDLTYCLSLEEQRARFQQLNQVLKVISQNDIVKHKLFVESFQNQNRVRILEQYFAVVDNLIRIISNNNIIKNITKIQIIEELIHRIENMKKTNKTDFLKCCYVLGYYLYKHEMLKFNLNNYNFNNRYIKDIFSETNVKLCVNNQFSKMKYFEFNNQICNFVIDNVYYSLWLYSKTIYKIIDKWKNKIFNYEEYVDNVEMMNEVGVFVNLPVRRVNLIENYTI